ncbi:MAG: isoleucine--tRNA ligase [Clostridia bacterium]|nr:isoleucine--tRNA ligase [Clostridia bacterium]
MYDKVSSNLNFVENEKKVLKFWGENDVFKKSIDLRKDGDTFTFYDGPPTANGKPHIGHVLTRVIKDLIPRYRTMKGDKVLRKAGWDTHGLPVELEVEKLLGLDGKEQIEQYGLEEFITKCKESVWKYKGMWEDFSDTVGFWADMDDPYVTYDNNFIESEWWALKQIWERGLLYKGFKIVPYCPRCGTPLSSHEVAQGYKDVKEKSVTVKMKQKGTDNTYFLVWTTTPWTLPSNVALCVNANIPYVKIKVEDEIYILAKDLISSNISQEYEILQEMQGSELENLEYEPLYSFKALDKKAYYVTLGDYVTTTDGTGIVHIAPAFGEDDAKIGRNYDLPFLQLVDSKGQMTPETPWAGTFCKDADKEIIKDLNMRGLMFKTLQYEHSYPFCWRCDTPLIYYARESWFIKMTEVKDELIANNNTINWIPESIGKGRFGDWLNNIQDWGISRDRYWGTPLNIWICDCGHKHAIGSIEELKSMSDNCPDDIELHRPYIDAVTIKCPKCGGSMTRTKEVIDCWFDSGSMPFAQWHYPFENKEIFDDNFPADFISEAVDQTRGWFYSLLAISTLIFHKAPYKNVIVLGLVQDENGQKMSKSKGNAVDPFEALAQFGADAIRWYFYSNSAPWLPNKFYAKAVQEGQRKFLGTLWNTYAFYVLYAEIDQFDPTKYTLDYDKLSVMDKWILSKLNTLVKNTDNNLSNYRITETSRDLQDFIDELSNWYVRRCRDRYWAKGMEQDKINAYMTLYTVLVTLCKISAPMIPFMTELIYRNIVVNVDKTAPISIHFCDYPVCNESYIDEELESQMKHVLDIVVLGREARNNTSIKTRQPLARMMVQADFELNEFYKEIVLEELNVKSLEFVKDADQYVTYTFKPQLKTLGPRLGKNIGKLKGILETVNGNEVMNELSSRGVFTVNIDGASYDLAKEDLLITTTHKEGYAVTQYGGVCVVLDITLSDSLIEEGFVREIISRIQTMRKEAGFEVMDHITIYQAKSDEIKKYLSNNEATVMDETLSDKIEYTDDICDSDVYVKDWNLNGIDVQLGVKRNAI